MSQPGTQYPYASPPAAYQAAAAFKPIDRIEYLRAYHYIFDNPNGPTNVAWGFLCLISQMIVPVVGRLVLLGYEFEVIQGLLQTQGARYPDFDINRFADYLARSLWPFLVGLVLGIPLLIVFYGAVIVVALAAAAGAAMGGDDLGPALAILIAFIGGAMLVAVLVAGIGLLLPLVLRAGLIQDFGGAFDFGWGIDFLKKTWLEITLVLLFLMATGIGLLLVGFMALCIGMWVALAIVMLAKAHLLYQLYLLYLSRGGTPVPLKMAVPHVMGKPL